KIARVDEKDVAEIAREMEERVARLRQRRDRQVERTKSILDRLPLRLLGPFLRLISYLVYDLDLDLSRFGVVKDEFGSAMVTNVGRRGLAWRRRCPAHEAELAAGARSVAAIRAVAGAARRAGTERRDATRAGAREQQPRGGSEIEVETAVTA